MKKVLFLLTTSLLFLSCAGLKRMEKRPMLVTRPATLTLEGSGEESPMVDVEYSLDVPPNYINKGGQLIYQPQFSNGINSKNLTPIVISGKRAARRELRAVKRGKELAISDGIRLLGDKSATSMDYSTSVAVESWMPTADLTGWSIYSDRKGKQTTIQKQLLASGIKMPKKKKQMAKKPLIEYKDVITKEEMTTKLYFKMNIYSYDISFANNRAQIDSTLSLLKQIEMDTTLMLTKIEVVGSASPDGTTKINSVLAQQRAETLAKMLEDRCNVSPSMIHVSSTGANWHGLIEAVESSNMTAAQKQQIVNIASASGSDAVKSYKLRNLQTFSILKSSYLPHLRSVTCEIFYTKSKIVTVEVK